MTSPAEQIKPNWVFINTPSKTFADSRREFVFDLKTHFDFLIFLLSARNADYRHQMIDIN